MNKILEAKNKYPDLWNELLVLDYVLTWGYTDNTEMDTARLIEIRNIIYN